LAKKGNLTYTLDLLAKTLSLSQLCDFKERIEQEIKDRETVEKPETPVLEKNTKLQSQNIIHEKRSRRSQRKIVRESASQDHINEDPREILQGNESSPVLNDMADVPFGEVIPVEENDGTPVKETTANLESAIQSWVDDLKGHGFVIRDEDERHEETINADEVKSYLARFQGHRCYSTFLVMPLIFSLDWPSEYLVLHSSILDGAKSHEIPLISLDSTRLMPQHERIIVPCCYEHHWTLFSINLPEQTVHHYDSIEFRAPSRRYRDLYQYLWKLIILLCPTFKKSDIKKGVSPLALGAVRTHGGQVAKKQENDVDCGPLTVFHADRLSRGEDGPLPKELNTVDLRHEHLCRLRQLSSIQILESAKESGVKRSRSSEHSSWYKFNPKRPRIDHSSSLPELEKEESVRKDSRMTQNRKRDIKVMVEAIGSEGILKALDEMVRKEEHRKVAERAVHLKSPDHIVYQLLEDIEIRGIRNKAIKRFAQYCFTRLINQRVEELQEQGPPSKRSGPRKPSGSGQGHAIPRALNDFLDTVRPDLPAHEKEQRRKRLRDWRNEGQIFVQLVEEFQNVTVLLLLPYGSPPGQEGTWSSRR
jgi:hypothetical protein